MASRLISRVRDLTSLRSVTYSGPFRMNVTQTVQTQLHHAQCLRNVYYSKTSSSSFNTLPFNDYNRSASLVALSSSLISCFCFLTTSCEDVRKQDKKNITNSASSSNNNILSEEIMKQLDEYAQYVGLKFQDAINTGIPTELSYGFVCGYSSGYALKKVGKMVSLAFGLSFAVFQSLAYAGYIQFNHEAFKKDLMDKYLDLNQDGKVDEQDLKLLYNKALEILTYNIPGGAGFSAGFIGGLRAG